jgi:hypothetical protein
LANQDTIVAEDEQEFFKGYFDSISKTNGEKVQVAPSVVGPMGAAAYTAAYTNIGGIEEERWLKLGIGKVRITRDSEVDIHIRSHFMILIHQLYHRNKPNLQTQRQLLVELSQMALQMA